MICHGLPLNSTPRGGGVTTVGVKYAFLMLRVGESSDFILAKYRVVCSHSCYVLGSTVQYYHVVMRKSHGSDDQHRFRVISIRFSADDITALTRVVFVVRNSEYSTTQEHACLSINFKRTKDKRCSDRNMRVVWTFNKVCRESIRCCTSYTESEQLS